MIQICILMLLIYIFIIMCGMFYFIKEISKQINSVIERLFNIKSNNLNIDKNAS